MIGFKKEIIEQKKQKAIDLPKDNKERTYIIYDMDAIKEFSKSCLLYAKENEFQVGYEALHIEIKKDEKIVNIVIPTCYYNFKQEVTHSFIDYHLNDVQKSYEEIKNKVNVKKEFESLLNEIKNLEQLGLKISFKVGDFGSIHRHPIKCKFSMQDLKNDPNETGIIYRKATFKGLQVDSIIYIPNNQAEKTQLFHSEARRVDVKEVENGIKGTYTKQDCFNVYFSKKGFAKKIDFNDILNLKEIKDKKEKYHKYQNKKSKCLLIDEVMRIYKELNFSVNINEIKPKLIKEKIIFKRNEYPVNDDTDFIECMIYKDENLIKREILELENIGKYYEPVYKYKEMIFSNINNYVQKKDGLTYIMEV